MNRADTTFECICRDKPAAHEAAVHAYAQAQALLADGKTVRISCGEDLEPITVKQRKFLHGPVFGQISEQVRMPDGTRYTTDIWKEFFRKLFLEAEPLYELRAVPKWDAKLGRLVQPKRKTPYRVRQSTEDLGIKAYSEHIDKVIAHAATELGVEFVFDIDEREAVRYRPPARKAKAQVQEAEAAPA